MHTREIGGVDVAIHTDGDTVVVEIGGERMSPEDVDTLQLGPDWCRTVEIGPYTFGERSLTELQEFVRNPEGAARAGSDDAPPDPNLRGINLARRAAALLAEVVATQEEIGASENLDFARQVHRAATQLAGALRAKPAC